MSAEVNSLMDFKAKAAGRSIMLASFGTRGDSQPFIALCLGLKKAGFRVCICLTATTVPLAEQFGLEAFPVFHDVAKMFEENLEFRAAMAAGSMTRMIKANAENIKEESPGTWRAARKLVADWKPDLILASPLAIYFFKALAGIHNIPCIEVTLTSYVPQKDQQSLFGEPSCCPHRMLQTLLLYIIFRQEKEHKAVLVQESMPEAFTLTAQRFREQMLEIFHPITPVLVGANQIMLPPTTDWPEDLKKQWKVVGLWTIGKDEQLTRMERGEGNFGGEDCERIKAFMESGEPPVYMGWGSMLSTPKHMTCLAVRCLMRIKRRGVLMRGWAHLDPVHLEDQPDAAALLSYVKDNVLFVESAAHEWLFPQCCCIVHHGGLGTTTAALRSGVPAVIAPVAFDQFQNGNFLTRHGVGVQTKQLAKLQARDLASAITACLGSERMRLRCKEIAGQFDGRDSVLASVKIIDDFLVDDADTGKWKARYDRRRREVAYLRKQSPSCWQWIGRFCCSSSPNDYSLKGCKLDD